MARRLTREQNAADARQETGPAWTPAERQRSDAGEEEPATEGSDGRRRRSKRGQPARDSGFPARGEPMPAQLSARRPAQDAAERHGGRQGDFPWRLTCQRSRNRFLRGARGYTPRIDPRRDASVWRRFAGPACAADDRRFRFAATKPWPSGGPRSARRRLRPAIGPSAGVGSLRLAARSVSARRRRCLRPAGGRASFSAWRRGRRLWTFQARRVWTISASGSPLAWAALVMLGPVLPAFARRSPLVLSLLVPPSVAVRVHVVGVEHSVHV